MSRALRLERFDLASHTVRHDAVPGASGAKLTAPDLGEEPGRAPTQPGAALDETTGPAPDTGGRDPNDLVPGAGQGADPGEETSRALSLIAEALERIAQDRRSLRTEVENALAERFGRAAAAALPTIAREGFAGEVAAAIRALLQVGVPDGLGLRIAPADRDAVEAALLAEQATDGCTREQAALPLVTDPALAPGTVEIDWHDGGAVLDAQALADAALGALAVTETEETGP